jgi:hypothetical protein
MTNHPALPAAGGRPSRLRTPWRPAAATNSSTMSGSGTPGSGLTVVRGRQHDALERRGVWRPSAGCKLGIEQPLAPGPLIANEDFPGKLTSDHRELAHA